ncbi:MAG: HAD family hydrolase [Armatimonadota bacterium]
MDKMPILSASHILVDVDGTLTGTADPPPSGIGNYGDVFQSAWRECHANSDQAPPPLSESECIFSSAAREGVPSDLLWNRLLDYHRSIGLEVFPDAERFLAGIKERSMKVFSATTNSRMMTLAKLAMGNIADENGSPFFQGFFGGDIIPEGKSCPGFFSAILKSLGVPPNEVVMVGDDITMDAAYAHGAGINQIIIVKRDGADGWRLGEHGAIIVSDLCIALDWLRLTPKSA